MLRHRGDYRRGYMGDPGLFSFAKKIVGKAAGAAVKMLPGPAGAIVRTALPVVGGVIAGRALERQAQPGGTLIGMRGTGPGGRSFTMGVETTRGATVTMDPNTGEIKKKRRRMNVLNPKALRRSIRRTKGFAKFARKVLTFPVTRPPKGRALFKRKR